MSCEVRRRGIPRLRNGLRERARRVLGLPRVVDPKCVARTVKAIIDDVTGSSVFRTKSPAALCYVGQILERAIRLTSSVLQDAGSRVAEIFGSWVALGLNWPSTTAGRPIMVMKNHG